MSAVAGIFAKETGYGFAFSVAQSPVTSLAEATASPEPAIEAALTADVNAAKQSGDVRKRSKVKPRASHLQVIK